jgi:hypothetical protein
MLIAGTSACACALSASFDSLSGGSISRGIAATFGTIFGNQHSVLREKQKNLFQN